jgi:hypothetical protein
MSTALWFAVPMTTIAEGAVILASRLPLTSFWSQYFAFLAVLAVPGIFVGVFLTGIAEGNPHGGGNSVAILLIATPVNLFVYGVLALAVIKAARKLRTR